MTELTPSQHNTLSALSKALYLAINVLPAQFVGLDTLTSTIALEVVNRLQFKHFPQDDQLAALLWTLPRDEICRLAPNYLIPVIEALSALWQHILVRLNDHSLNTIDTPNLDAPTRARSIAAIFLTVVSEHHRQTGFAMIDRNHLKAFLNNFLMVARELARKLPDTTGDDLLASVKHSIVQAGFTDELLPELTWVWYIRANASADLANEDAQKIVEQLYQFIRQQWLITGKFPSELHRDTEFFVRIEPGRDGNDGAIDRLMASFAARFPKLFTIRKIRYSDKLKSVQWNRAVVGSWMSGIGYCAAHNRLLACELADPLPQIANCEDDRNPTEQFKAFGQFVNLS